MKGIRYSTMLCSAFLMISITHNVTTPATASPEPSRLQRWVTDLIDFMDREQLGYTGVSEKTEEFVRGIQKELGMQNICIPIRQMSKHAIRMLGKDNACAYFDVLILNEKWFKKLPEQEKRFLVGHELGHIKMKHCLKNYLSGVAVGLFTVGSGYLLSKYYSEPYQQIKNQLNNFIVVIPFLANIPFLIRSVFSNTYSRSQEREADKIAAIELNNIEGGIALMERFKKKHDPYSRFSLKRLFYNHPSPDERIEYLKQLATTQQTASQD